MMAKIGWTPGANENADIHTLRGNLIHILGIAGEDPETVRQATSVAQQYLKEPNSVDASIARDVLAVAARFGNEELFQQYVSAMSRMRTPEQFYNVGGALSQFRDPKVVEKVLEFAVSNEVRNQDASSLISRVLINPDNQKTAWEWVKSHWPLVEKKITMSSGPEIVMATRGFCSVEMNDDVQKFFIEHKVPSAERALKQSSEDIAGCVKRRPRLQTELAQWLQQHGAGNKAASR
jgi:aminopeptidase N